MGHNRRLTKIKKRQFAMHASTVSRPCMGNCGGAPPPASSSNGSKLESNSSASKTRCLVMETKFECVQMQEEFLKCAQQQRILKNRKCAVCGTKKDLAYCAKCHKVSYCSKEHQGKDWKVHKGACFPCTEVTLEEQADYFPYELHGPLGFGPYFRASRDIAQYGVILVETPLMTGPGCSLNQDYEPLCLGCTKPIAEKQKCSKCQWPVCGPSCEKDSRHSDNECEIFAKNKVKELFDPFQYELVRILRCLLLKTKDPLVFEELVELEGAYDQRKIFESLVAATSTACIFINENCKLKEFDRDIIDNICGIVDLQTQVSGPHRTTMQIFSYPAKLAHSCSPNCRLVDIFQPKGENVLMLMPLQDIVEGTLLTRCLLDNPVLPTYRRQLFYNDMYYFTCCCMLCRDVTENGTYFSGVKCTKGQQVVKEECGYLLPKAAMDVSVSWMCTKCKMEREGDKLYSFLNSYDKVDVAFRKKMKQLPPVQAIKSTRERIKLLESQLHPNNYIVVKTKMLLLSKLREYLLTMEKPSTVKVITKLYEEAEHIGTNLLRLVHRLRMHVPLTRGLVVFHLASSRWAYMRWAISFGVKDSFDKQGFIADFDRLVIETVKILDLEAADARHLIDQLMYMKQNVNKVMQISPSKPTSVEQTDQTDPSCVRTAQKCNK